MSVHINKIMTICGYTIYSVSHWYLQEGDVMQDPEMLFWNDLNDKELFYAGLYRHDALGIYQESIYVIHVNNLPEIRFWWRMQAEHTRFANEWLKTIVEQQGIIIPNTKKKEI